MPRILLLAATTGYQTRAFGDAAERVGVELVFATDRCHVLVDPWQDGAVPVRFHDESGSVAAILDALRARPVEGIIALGDRPTVIAARVAEALDLPGHPPEAAAAARDKQRTRERLRDAGLPVPWFLGSRIDVNPRDLAGRLSFPCVIKPVALSGSRGVIRADDAEGFLIAFERLRSLLQLPEIRAERNEAHDRILVEGFIPGREFAVEGLLHHGALSVLALFDKPDPLDGPFFEETIYVTPSSVPAGVATSIAGAVSRAAAAIGLRHGPIHAECRLAARGESPTAFGRRCIPPGCVTPPSNIPDILGRRALPVGRIAGLGADAGAVFVLEVAARPIGGLCSQALRFEEKGVSRSLFSLEELLLRHALDEPPGAWSREPRASGVMMIPIPRRGVYRRASGVEDARRIDGVDQVIVTAKEDQLLVPLPEGGSYLGFIFARGETRDAVERSLRMAHARLGFTIESEVRLDKMRG